MEYRELDTLRVVGQPKQRWQARLIVKDLKEIHEVLEKESGRKVKDFKVHKRERRVRRRGRKERDAIRQITIKWRNSKSM